MDAESIFFIIWCTVILIVIYVLYKNGKEEMKLFPEWNIVEKRFEERWCTGFKGPYRSLYGGAAKSILRVAVTKNEFWVASSPIHAKTLVGSGLLLRLDLVQLVLITPHRRKYLTVRYRDNENTKEVTLRLNKRDKLVAVLEKLTSQKLVNTLIQP